MGHDAHFLERLDRVTRTEADFALGLYRDHDALKYVLEHARVPEGAERVALAVAAGGPHVVVTREGRFVTCLGAGMTTGALPIVPRARLEALLAAVRDLRERRQMAERIYRPGEGPEDLYDRLFERGDALSREEFVAISGWQPVLGPRAYHAMLGNALLVAEQQASRQPVVRSGAKADAGLEAFWGLYWSIGHCALLSAMGARDWMTEHLDSMSAKGVAVPAILSDLGSGLLALRGWWMAARVGKPLVPIYKRILANDASPYARLDAALSLVAIALRHGGLAAEIRKAIDAPSPESIESPDVLSAGLAPALLEILDDPDAAAARAVGYGRDVFATRTEHIDPAEGSPWRFPSAADVPDDLALGAALSVVDYDLWREHSVDFALVMIAAVARAKAEDFYLPRAASNLVRVPYSKERALELLQRSAASGNPKPKPVRAAPRPGRNDACPCGSGKKFKKCCGKT